MTNKENYPTYLLAGVAAAALAVWAGLPITVLFLLICPAMMFFVMRGTGGVHDSRSKDDDAADRDPAKRADVSTLDGSHERIE
jgi:hypothetical protein